MQEELTITPPKRLKGALLRYPLRYKRLLPASTLSAPNRALLLRLCEEGGLVHLPDNNLHRAAEAGYLRASGGVEPLPPGTDVADLVDRGMLEHSGAGELLLITVPGRRAVGMSRI